MSSLTTATVANGKTTSADQVTIDVGTLSDQLNVNKEKDSLSAGFIAVDGRHSGHRSHGNHSSHHYNHSGESDTDEKRHGRRHRRRSRSRSRSPSNQSPSNRTKRASESGVSHRILFKRLVFFNRIRL